MSNSSVPMGALSCCTSQVVSKGSEDDSAIKYTELECFLPLEMNMEMLAGLKAVASTASQAR